MEIKVLSHVDFDELCEENNWSDSNIPENIAFISIIGTDFIRDRFLERKDGHWFKEEHDNVLNLEFDDVEREFEFKDGKAYPISDEQVKKSVSFIMNNLGKDFIIHCYAGISRSVAFGSFIKQVNGDYKTNKEFLFPNQDVLIKLKRCYREDYLKSFEKK